MHFLQRGCMAGNSFILYIIKGPNQKHKSSDSGQRKCTEPINGIRVLPSQVFYLKRCVSEREDVEHLTFITFQYTLHLGSILHRLCRPSILPFRCLFSPLSPFIEIAHPKRNNIVSSPALTMMHEPYGKHFAGVVCFVSLSFQRAVEKKHTKTGPNTNVFKAFHCGALAAGFSSFQLPDIFN